MEPQAGAADIGRHLVTGLHLNGRYPRHHHRTEPTVNIHDLGALHRANETLLTTLAILAGLGLLLAITRRIRRMKDHRLTLLVANILTMFAAALATMVSASGMWKFFTDVLGPSPLRIVFFAYLEIALFASALLARTRLLREPEKGSTGVDGVAVWVLAALTAGLSALDADSFREVCLRLVAPLVAAWMWERVLAAERSARLGKAVRADVPGSAAPVSTSICCRAGRRLPGGYAALTAA